jgi:hypothetical protein
MENDIEMVGECTSSYQVIEQSYGGVEIVIKIPARFKNLWLVRLSGLRTTEQEIKEYEDD